MVQEEPKGGSLTRYLDVRRGKSLSRHVVRGLFLQILELLILGSKLGLLFGEGLSITSLGLSSVIADDDMESVPCLIVTDLGHMRL